MSRPRNNSPTEGVIFWANVKHILRERGIGVMQMCRDLGFHRGSYSSWRRNNIIPSAPRVAMIAGYLHTSVENLFQKRSDVMYSDYG